MAAAMIKTVVDLNGNWKAGNTASAVISVVSTSLTIDMSAYNRPAAQGSIVDSFTITVTFPDDQTYTGKLQLPNLIKWLNGTAWTKLTMAPQNILEIVHQNPGPPTDPNWAKTPEGEIPGLGGEFPYPPSEKEWEQVLAPHEEYDVDLAGASGWVINPRPSGSDLPFTHPFGKDWEFELALDQPNDDPNKYTSLLASGNRAAKTDKDGDLDASEMASKLEIPVPDGGLLGVEWEGNFVPRTFQEHVKTGDRVAVFGRWILDKAHPYNGGFRTEIHPPLLMAVANADLTADGSPATRVLFNSRPYLVGQTFITDTDQIYDDRAQDDGHFFKHLLKEIRKVNSTNIDIGIGKIPIPIPSSRFIEAHPKIKSYPFTGARLAHFVIRPPAHDHILTNSSLSTHGGIGTYRLAVSFHFTIRSGCAVQVTSTTSDAIDVFVVLNNVGYTPPPLPERREHAYSREELAKLDSDASTGYLAVETLNVALRALGLGDLVGATYAALIEERGIKTDEYNPLPDVNVLDSTNAVINAPANNIPAKMGITVDNAQPYPIYGWLEAKWISVSDKQPA